MKHVAGYWQPVGTVIDAPDCFYLVQQGCAEPADVECGTAAAMTPERFAAAKRAYDFLEKGIDREDWDAYERGEMIGYDEHGHWVPGPNYVEPEISAKDEAMLDILNRLLGGGE